MQLLQFLQEFEWFWLDSGWDHGYYFSLFTFYWENLQMLEKGWMAIPFENIENGYEIKFPDWISITISYPLPFKKIMVMGKNMK